MSQDGSPRWAQTIPVEHRELYEKSHFGTIGWQGDAYMCRPEFGDIVQSLNAGLRKFKKSTEYTSLCARYPSIDCDPNEAQWLNAKTSAYPKAADHPTTRADIVIATEAAWQPFNYIEDGELKGFDIELTKAVCKAAGKICAIVTVPWQSVWPEGYPEFGWDTNPKMYPGIGTNSGWFHCTSGTINTLRRQQATAFTDPYSQRPKAGFVTPKASPITANAAGKSVAVIAGWAISDFFHQNSGASKQFHPSKITALGTSGDVWAMLEKNAVDAVYIESNKADEYLNSALNAESMPHFFADGIRQSASMVLAGYPFEGNLTDGGEWYLSDGKRLSEIFMSCGDRCRGGPNFECAEGRAGRLCQQCATGYALMLNECYKCYNDYRDWLVAIFGISAVMCVFEVPVLTMLSHPRLPKKCVKGG